MNHAELIARIKDEARMWRGNIEALEATGCDEIELETADHERLIKILKEAADALERLTAGDVSLPQSLSIFVNSVKVYSENECKDYGDRRAAAAVLAERERCAVVCSRQFPEDANDESTYDIAVQHCIEAIRKGTS